MRRLRIGLRRMIVAATLAATLAAAMAAAAAIPAMTPEIGIKERLGECIPLDEVHFTGEEGIPVALADLFDRPSC